MIDCLFGSHLGVGEAGMMRNEVMVLLTEHCGKDPFPSRRTTDGTVCYKEYKQYIYLLPLLLVAG